VALEDLNTKPDKLLLLEEQRLADFASLSRFILNRTSCENQSSNNSHIQNKMKD
jgi:hypothetical protein